MRGITSREIFFRNGNYHLRQVPRAGGLLFVSAEWCGYCKRASPELLKVSRITGSGFPIYKLDADKNKDAVKKLGVSGFPTIFYVLPTGIIQGRYEGERTYQAILDDICKKAKKCYGTGYTRR